MEPVVEAAAQAADGLAGGVYIEPIDVGKIPYVDDGLNYAKDLGAKSYNMVMDVLAPYQLIDPLKVLVLLYIVKFLVTLPLANVFKTDRDVCYNTEKFCGNTFKTFYTITKLLISWMIFIFYVRVMSAGFSESGIFSIRAFLPIATVTILVLLAIWFLKAIRFIKSEYPFFSIGAGAGEIDPAEPAPYTLWHLIKAHASENMTGLAAPVAGSYGSSLGLGIGNEISGNVINGIAAGGTTLFWIIAVAAIVSLSR